MNECHESALKKFIMPKILYKPVLIHFRTLISSLLTSKFIRRIGISKVNIMRTV